MGTASMNRGENINPTDEGREMLRALLADKQVALEPAMSSVARATGMSKWGVWNLYHGRRKSLAATTLMAIRREYIRLCERQLARAEADLRWARGLCGDESITDIAAALAAVAQDVQAAKARVM